MKSKKTLTILVFGILNFILALFILGKLSDQVPIYVFKENLIDKMDSKNLLMIFPTIILIFTLAQVLYRLKTMNKVITTVKLVEDAVFTVITGIAVLIQWIMTYIAHMYTQNNIPKVDIPIINILIVVFGIIIITVASLIQITKKNSYLGFRTKETLNDEEVWRKTNRFAGTMGFIAGAIIISSSVKMLMSDKGIICFLLALIIALIVAIIFPILYGKKLSDEKEIKE